MAAAVVILDSGNNNMDTGLGNLDQVVVINDGITDALQEDLHRLDRINDEVFGI